MNALSNPDTGSPTDNTGGLDPVTGPEPRVLILGSFPSRKSLQYHEYYGNPKNHFWKIMEALFAIDATRPYADRIDQIRRNNLALWDVVRSCNRPGSADARISDPVFNDITGFAAAHPALQLIALNGSAAARFYPGTITDTGLPFVVLPSTSPANARLTLQEKIERWSVIKEESSG